MGLEGESLSIGEYNFICLTFELNINIGMCFLIYGFNGYMANDNFNTSWQLCEDKSKDNKVLNKFSHVCLVVAEHQIMDSIPGHNKTFLGFSIRPKMPMIVITRLMKR